MNWELLHEAIELEVMAHEYGFRLLGRDEPIIDYQRKLAAFVNAINEHRAQEREEQVLAEYAKHLHSS